jgi:hypothetical protein
MVAGVAVAGERAIPAITADVERTVFSVDADGSPRAVRSTGSFSRAANGETTVEMDGSVVRGLAPQSAGAATSIRGQVRASGSAPAESGSYGPLDVVAKESLGTAVVAGTPCRRRRMEAILPAGKARNAETLRYTLEVCYSDELGIPVRSTLFSSAENATFSETVRVRRAVPPVRGARSIE